MNSWKLRSRIVYILLLSLLLIDPPLSYGDGEVYVGAYNELMRMLIDRCAAAGRSTDGLSLRNLGDSVSQGDMNVMRSNIVAMMTNAYVVDGPQSQATSAAEAFPYGLRYDTNGILRLPSLMNGIGNNGVFTKVPGSLTSGGQTICSNDFVNVPLLWVHFDEIHRALCRMSETRPTGSWAWASPNPSTNRWQTFKSYSSSTPPTCDQFQLPPVIKQGLYVSGPQGATYISGYAGSWIAQAFKWRTPYRVTGLSTSILHSLEFYNYAVLFSTNGSWEDNGALVSQNAWNNWCSLAGCYSNSCESTPLGPPATTVTCCGAPGVCGFSVTAWAAIVHWAGLYVGTIVNPAQNDPAYDGLAYSGCQQCPGSASSCPILPTVSWKSGPNNGGQARFPLGVSSPLTNGGLSVRAYIEEYSVGGLPRQMFSLDTRVLSRSSDTNEGWEFVVVKRPSGAEVVFSLAGSSSGKAVNLGQNYTASVTTNGEVEITFPASGDIVHRFDSVSGKIAEVYPKATPYLSIHGSSSQWPGMTTYRDGDMLLSNVCPLVTAELTNSAGLVTGVAYSDPDGNAIADLSVLPGSRIYRMTDGSGNLMDETHYRSDPTNHTDEIWYGVTTNPSLSVAKKVIRQESFNASNMLATLTETVILNPDTANAYSNVMLTVSKQFSWGQEPLSITTGYGSADPQTTYFTWYTNAADAGSCGRLELIENPDRSWSKYQYDDSGRESVVLTPFKNAGPDSATNECRVTRSHYAGDSILSSLNFPSDITFTNDQRSRLVVEEAAGAEISRIYYAYFSDRAVTKRCHSAGAAYDDTNNIVTTTYYCTNGAGNGRVQRIERPDGTISTFDYSYDGVLEQLTITEDAGAGDDAVTNGTRTVSVRNSVDQIVSVETRDIESGITLSAQTNTYDNRARLAATSNSISGAASEYTYACCDAPESIRDSDGILTEYAYNDLKQTYSAERLSITTYFDYDEDGNVVRTRKTASGMADIASSFVYDESGRLIAATNELGQVAIYAYSTNSEGERVVTTTHPDTSTRVETYYRDGGLKSVAGTAATAQFYDYGADTNGSYTVEYYGSNSFAPAWVKSYVDMLGQSWKTVYPDGCTKTISYDSKGRPVKESDGLTTRLTQYNGNGEPVVVAVDMNGNDAVDLAGNDRVTETVSSYTVFESKGVQETTTRVYPTVGSSTPLVASVQRRSVDGLTSWNIACGRTNRTDVATDAATASRVETTTQAHGSQVVSCYTNSLLMTVVRKASGGAAISTTRYGYDAFGRQNSVSEPAANGETRTTTTGYDAAGNITSAVVSAGSLTQITSCEYDPMGRRVKMVLPDGGEVNYTFTQKGELSGQNGARTYPVTYTYDAQGRMETLSTYRNGLSGSADVTTWQYDPQRGRLTTKVFADGTSNSYEYLQNGLLKKSVWARGIDAEYDYDAAGSLTNVNYSDTTPDVAYSLDRLGRAVEVTDGIGTWTNTYLADGQLESVTLPQVADGVLEYERDALSRLTNIAVSIEGTRSVASAYSYDNAGRIAIVGDGTHTVSYTYGPDGTTWTNLDYGGPLNVQRTFDGLGRLTLIVNQPSNAPPMSFSYSNNQADQRTTNSLADGSRWVYTYDSLGQVVSAKKFFPDVVPVGGAQFEYEFDTIGNRKTAKNLMGTSSVVEQYTANGLNQYENRTVAGKVLVTGEAATNATVSVRLDENSTAKLANRHGECFWQALDATNASTLVAITNLQVRAFMTVVEGTNTNSLVRTETRQEIVPQTPEAFTWDVDGNLTSDGLWTNTWDANNRMVLAESGSGVPAAFKRRLTFQYDSMGRRIVKHVESGYSGGAYSTTNSTTYVWDGWDIIAQIRSQPSGVTTNFYTWALDLSGSLQGAGGVGGLAVVSLDGTNYLPFCNGNGDVMGLVDSTDGRIVAEYEYSPVGMLLKCSGPLAKANPFRFSSKPTDDENGVVAYQQRDYRPDMARFTSRDPLEEDVGPNLYALLGNQPISQVDDLGLALYAFDGTANVPSDNTNVELTRRSGYRGTAEYEEGIGNADEHTFLTRTLRQGTGWGLTAKKNTMMAKLKDNLRAGDLDVDIIGFSRGGVTAIVFAEAIGKLKGEGVEPFCKIDSIRFMGLYDPVPGPTIAHRPGIPSLVKRAAIAYSLDEKRTQFTPSLYSGPNITAFAFRGGHSDVGGGYKDRGLANISLEWMIGQGLAAGGPFVYPTVPGGGFSDLMIRHQETMALYSYADRDLLIGGSAVPLHPSVRRLVGYRLGGSMNRKGVSLTPMAYYWDYIAPGRDKF